MGTRLGVATLKGVFAEFYKRVAAPSAAKLASFVTTLAQRYPDFMHPIIRGPQ